MSYVATPGQVAYDESRSEERVVHVPRPWRKFFANWNGSGIPRTSGTLFLHERSTPIGKRRLVVVDVVSIKGTRDLQVQSRVFEPPVGIAPARLISAATETLGLPADPGHLQIFAGQIDPKNASHFILTYAIGNHHGLIDGWLKNDQTVILELRNPLNDATQPANVP